MIVKILTKTDGRNTWLLYDNISTVTYNDCPFEVFTVKESLSILKSCTLGVFPNGSIENWNLKEENVIIHSELLSECNETPFTYNIITFVDKTGENISIMFNGIAYLCNDKGNTIQKIKGQ